MQRSTHKPEGRKPSELVTAGESGQGLDEAQAPGSRYLSLANISRSQRPGGDSSQWRYVTEPDQRPNSSCGSGQSPWCYLQRVKPGEGTGIRPWSCAHPPHAQPPWGDQGTPASSCASLAEYRPVVPTRRLCQGGEPTVWWEREWVGL